MNTIDRINQNQAASLNTFNFRPTLIDLFGTGGCNFSKSCPNKIWKGKKRPKFGATTWSVSWWIL